MAKSDHITMTEQERNLGLSPIQKGRTSARRLRRAQILLAAADGQHYAASAGWPAISPGSEESFRKREAILSRLEMNFRNEGRGAGLFCRGSSARSPLP